MSQRMLDLFKKPGDKDYTGARGYSPDGAGGSSSMVFTEEGAIKKERFRYYMVLQNVLIFPMKWGAK